MGLAAALQSYCEDYARATRLDCEALVDGEVDSAGPMQAIALFRIAQESLNNIAKYAQARHVVVHLAREGEGWRWKSATTASAFRPMRCAAEIAWPAGHARTRAAAGRDA
jgi:signal transduction histidine kinase